MNDHSEFHVRNRVQIVADYDFIPPAGPESDTHPLTEANVFEAQCPICGKVKESLNEERAQYLVQFHIDRRHSAGASGLRFGSGPAVNADTEPPEGSEVDSPHPPTSPNE